MMIDINKEKVMKLLRRGLAFALVIGLAAGYRVMNPGTAGVETMEGVDGVVNWGLSFDRGGEPPVGNATAAELAKYDAWYVGNTEKKTIYLTFDAGYENGYTAEILDVLKSHNVPAAFFLVGTYIRANPDLVKRMVDEGHIVGNHSMNHPDMSVISDAAAFEKELSSVETAYREVIGEGSANASKQENLEGKNEDKSVQLLKYYRPPQGKFSQNNLALAKKLGYKTIFWSLAYVDWNVDQQPTREEALNVLLTRTHKGAVVLLHSTSKTNAKVLGELIERWKTEGYQFGTLEELTKS